MTLTAAIAALRKRGAKPLGQREALVLAEGQRAPTTFADTLLALLEALQALAEAEQVDEAAADEWAASVKRPGPRHRAPKARVLDLYPNAVIYSLGRGQGYEVASGGRPLGHASTARYAWKNAADNLAAEVAEKGDGDG